MIEGEKNNDFNFSVLNFSSVSENKTSHEPRMDSTPFFQNEKRFSRQTSPIMLMV